MSKLNIDDTIAIDPDLAETTAKTLFLAAGAPPDVAQDVAKHLIDAEQCGVASHGIVRVLQYTREMLNGTLSPTARPEIMQDNHNRVTIQAHGGIGIPAMRFAHELAAERAKETGLSAVALLGVGHTGRLGAFGEIMAASGCLSITLGGGNRKKWRMVAPYGGTDALLPTNPYCISIPGADHGPVILDIATSQAAGGWIYAARAAGVNLPEGLIIDSAGDPSTNPEDYFNGGAILPKGGPLGYGLALIAELIGEAMLGPVLQGEINWLVLAMKCDWHADTHNMHAAADQILSEIRASTPASGHEKVQIPGEREREARMHAQGKPLEIPKRIWSDIEALKRSLETSGQ